jgi:glyoxylase-like metal-dependent hydrolase (beta-lactamase superfamily II)
MPSPAPNRRYVLGAALCACCVGAAPRRFSAARADAATPDLPTILELGVDPMTPVAPGVWVAQIAPSVWLHTTTHPVGGFVYPANGLILMRDEEALLIDTGWTPEQARALAGWIAAERKARIRLAVATHFHFDRTGGVDALKALGVRTVAHPLTTALARKNGLQTPEPLAGFERGAHRLDEGCELFYAGAGHSPDNICVFVPEARLLYGGCFLKSATSADLGNLADAVVADWGASVATLTARYAERKIVVPGHGALAGDPIGRTLALLAAKQH